jgi:pimeloyl-ACP methyl ester carboxylesterase
MEERHVTLGDIEFVFDYRQGSGTPIVFLHGTTASAATFSDVIDAVPTEREIYNFDLRGHGRSGWSATGDYLIEDHVKDIRRILADVTGPAIIVGWSLGAGAGLLAAGHDPELVKGILLGDATSFEVETEDRFNDVPVGPALLGLGEVVRQLPDHDLDWAIAEVGDLEIAGSKLRAVMSAAYLRDWVTEAGQMDPDVPSRQLVSPLSYSTEPLLERVTCPVRLVHGDPALGGIVLPEDVERMKACCQDFEARYEPRAGHGVHRRPVHEAFKADIQALAQLVP